MVTSKPFRQGFTLIELMVVVGIIALLIAVLIPSLSSARGQVHAVVCASNLRQIAAGWAVYADQNQGSIVPGRTGKFTGSPNTYFVGNGYQYRPRWFVQMGAESGCFAYDEPSPEQSDDNTKTVDNDLFVCPARKQWINNRNYTYGYNFQFLGNSRFLGGSEDNGFVNFPVKINHFSRLSSTVMAADNLGTAATFPERERKPYRVSGEEFREAFTNHGWALDPPRLTETGDFCNNSYRGEARSGPDPRHFGKANFLFCDTHIERLKPEEVGYVRRPDGSYPLPKDPLNEQAHNRRFTPRGGDSDPPVVE